MLTHAREYGGGGGGGGGGTHQIDNKGPASIVNRPPGNLRLQLE